MFYDKEYSCLANYGHTHACDNYYTKMYIIGHLIKQNEYITIIYYLEQRYICCAYIFISSKIYDILQDAYDDPELPLQYAPYTQNRANALF